MNGLTEVKDADSVCGATEARILDSVRTFDFGTIISLVLPLLIEQIAGCLAKRSKEDVVATVKHSTWARFYVSRGINRAAEQSGTKLTARQHEQLRDQILAQVSPAASQIVDEIAANTWGMV